MLPTPDLSHLSAADFELVYEPAEDTFALLDALEVDAALLRDLDPSIVLEIGCGSGCVSTFVSQLLAQKRSLFLCTDINPHAVVCTEATAKQNKVSLITVLTSLADGILPRIHKAVDILLFNPPYVPTDSSELDLAQGERSIAGAWAGGSDGMEVTERLLGVVPELLSQKGLFYLVCVRQNDPTGIALRMKDEYGLLCKIVLQRRAGGEHLVILRFQRCSS